MKSMRMIRKEFTLTDRKSDSRKILDAKRTEDKSQRENRGTTEKI